MGAFYALFGLLNQLILNTLLKIVNYFFGSSYEMIGFWIGFWIAILIGVLMSIRQWRKK